MVKQRKIVKRSGVNAQNQCVLRAASGLTPGTSEPTSTSTSTHTSSGSRASSKGSSTSTGKGSSTTTASSSSPTSSYKKVMDASGSDFFDSWYFFTGGDPTHGNVQYVDQQTAKSSNLISIDSNNNVFLRVDSTSPVSANRNSVRIHSNNEYTEGLWIMDAVHMPTGCGSWPAFWTAGDNWPTRGEIDILEGVNQNTYNQASLHTSPGCTLPQDFGGTGTLLAGSDCGSSQTTNQGCGIKDNSAVSYGAGFNKNGGGVYVMRWDNDDGISIWFFERDSIPNDIQSQQPLPSTWGQPSARFPTSSCNASQFFSQHTTIFDTTLCGDWAGGAWNTASNDGSPSCAQQTGFATCPQYVASNNAAFSEAYWQIKSVRIYQTS